MRPAKDMPVNGLSTAFILFQVEVGKQFDAYAVQNHPYWYSYKPNYMVPYLVLWVTRQAN